MIDFTADVDAYLDDYGRDVVYRPRNGMPRSIKAIYDPLPPEPVAEAPTTTLAQRIEMTVANDALKGVCADLLDTGGDKIEAQMRIGGEAKRLNITRIIGPHDEGFMKIEVR